jgi:rhomboid protease GluP
MDDSFARYLAKTLVVKHGYSEGTVPEAAKLAGACDLVLTKVDGLTFSAICIVDAERDPSRRFGLSRDELLEIGKACRARYAGRVNGAKMPATVEIVEVRGSVTSADQERLKPLRSRLGTVTSAYAVDRSASTVTVNAWSLFNPRRRLLERLLRQPRLDAGELVRPAPAALPEEKRRPVLTYLLVAGLAAVFVVEQLFPVAPARALFEPDLKTLVALGALSRRLVLEDGEWFRLFTAAFLHGSVIHLAGNGIALWMAGLVLEPLAGRGWLFSLFFVGALGGSLASMAINPADTVSVGASGAIMGLLAAALVLAFRFPSGGQRTAIHVSLLRVFIPSMIPLAVHSGPRIDFAAHLGGAVVGGLLGGLVLATWPRTAPRPRFAGAAVALALAGAVVLGWSGQQAHAAYGRRALARFLIPDEQLPKTDDEIASRARTLASVYPRDPRGRLFHAAVLLRANDPPGAEAELRKALAEKELLQLYFTPELEVALRSTLARALLAQSRTEDAKREAQPVCHAGPGGAVPKRLEPLRLCP